MVSASINSRLESVAPEELEHETSNNGSKLVDAVQVDGDAAVSLGGSSSPAAIKGRKLKTWRRVHGEGSKATNMINSSALIGDTRQRRSHSSVSTESVMANVLDNVSNSENSVNGSSSRSSTAASAPRMGDEMIPVVSVDLDSKNIQNPNGKNRIVIRKKAKGIKIEKKNSLSSMESDSRSSNSVINNGNQSDREDVSQDLAVLENSWEMNGLIDEDVLETSMVKLLSAHEQLEREVQNLKNVGKDDSSDEPSDSSNPELLSSEGSNILEPQKIEDLKHELDEMLKQRMEVEVQHIVISEGVQQSKRIHYVDRTELMEQQKKLELEQVELMKKLKGAESKAEELKKQSEKLEVTCQEILEKEEARKLQNRVKRLTSWFTVELILLFLVAYLFVLQFCSPKMEVVPT